MIKPRCSGCSVRQQQQHSKARITGVVVEVSCGDLLLLSAQKSSSTTSCSKEGAEEHAVATANVSGLSKKRKRMDTKTYRALFKPLIKANSIDQAVAIPDKAGKENTSSGNVADRNTAAAQQGSYSELPEPSTISELARNSDVPTDSTRLSRSEVSRLQCGPRATAATSSLASRGGGRKKLSAGRFARIDCECDVPEFMVLWVRISELR
ncbi:hypothetical protein ABZP36_006153 [Zizania latifolia]